ncbi:MAG TPA: CCA tRNA nucleotidyltransferase [Gemmataceae bacterium]|nr:CCA tRNA nucleotidyltransferase [Gemmataceae bacterium]
MSATQSERHFAIDVARRLRDAGYEALWAGGCVRDELLGLIPKDYDVATSAHPEQVRRLFRRTIAVGVSFGVIEVLGPRTAEGLLKVQVATFRSDVSYSDGRHPDAVVFSSAREDALRRDFTINGMFFDPLDNRLIDYVGGQDDLRARVLRAIGDPVQRFNEDKLRMLRAVRMATRFELEIDAATADAIRAMAPQIVVVSAERIADELRKLLVDPRRARGLRLFVDLGLARAVLPELLPMRGLPQGLPRPDAPALPPPGLPGLPAAEGSLDLWEHVLRVLDYLGESPTFPLAMASVLHDIGKPRTVGRTPERYTFYSHEHVGRRMAGDICERLKLSNDEQKRIEWLVEKHQILSDARQMRPSKLKTLLIHPGIRELLELHRADALATGRGIDHVAYCEQLLRQWSKDDLNPPPLLTGDDLIQAGYEPGPLFKKLLDAVREAQLDGTIHTPEEAWTMVDRLLSEGNESEPRP